MASRDRVPFLPAVAAREHDVCAVGTALIDYLSYAPLDVVVSLGLEPGAMTLVDGETAARIRATVGAGEVVASGGTVANTASGVASLGGHPLYVGAVATDDLGRHFASDLERIGVRPVLERISTAPGEATGTGTCYVIATPDHQRTMATTLGVSGLLSHATITASLVASSSLVYFDGYLLDFPDAKRIVDRLVELAAGSSTSVAIGLADPFVVERHGEWIRSLVAGVDLVFANREEALALSGAPTVEAAVEFVRARGPAVVVTCGPDGAVLANAEGISRVDAAPAEVADTTGAGDLFAAGVCYGATQGLDAEGCGRLGALCAAEVIGHLGARPATSLRALGEQAGLIGPS